MNGQKIVRKQRVADCAATDGRIRIMGEGFAGREVPLGKDLGPALADGGSEGGPLGGGDGLALGPQLAGRGAAPALGSR